MSGARSSVPVNPCAARAATASACRDGAVDAASWAASGLNSASVANGRRGWCCSVARAEGSPCGRRRARQTSRSRRASRGRRAGPAERRVAATTGPPDLIDTARHIARSTTAPERGPCRGVPAGSHGAPPPMSGDARRASRRAIERVVPRPARPTREREERRASAEGLFERAAVRELVRVPTWRRGYGARPDHLQDRFDTSSP